MKGLVMVIQIYTGFRFCFRYSKIKVIINFTLFYPPLDLPSKNVLVLQSFRKINLNPKQNIPIRISTDSKYCNVCLGMNL